MSQQAVDEGIYASYLPSDIPYNEEFQNDLASILVNPDAQTDNGIRVIPYGSDEVPEDGVSVRAKDIVLLNLPLIAKDELPLQLSDPRRIYASQIPGVKLTHPDGYYEGGPGQDPEAVAAANREYLSRNNIGSAAELEAQKKRELVEQLQQVKENAENRMKAIVHNENIRRQLAALEAQHQLELNLQKRMVAERKEKREAKEKKNKGEKAGE